MTLTGAKSISEITQDSLVQGLGKELPAALAPDGERECGIVVCAPHPNPLPQGEGTVRRCMYSLTLKRHRTLFFSLAPPGRAGGKKGRTAHQFSAILPPH